jgi:peptidoglycan-associated lipoprotein
MRKKIIGCIVVLSFGALVSGGCAKKDMVKSEEQIPAARTTPSQAETYKPTPREETAPGQLKAETVTPSGEATIKQETPKQEGTQGTELQNELQKIYFNFDSADLSAESRNALSKNAETLAKQPSVKLRIEGNCDERGSDEYNMALGERRAKAARDYLVNLGVQPDRLSIISYGEEKPADPGHDEAAWAKNRRDEFVIVK